MLLKMDSDFTSLDNDLKKDMEYSILEAVFSTLMGSMIGGAILTGFALALGADSFVIGILASLPLLANILQIIASYLVERAGDSKKVCISYIILHRIVWLIIILSPFILLRANLSDWRIWVFVLLLGMASIFASISSLSWNSWMADLIPLPLRGRFFARRNIAAQSVGMVAVVAAGFFLDYWQAHSGDSITESYGFIYLFGLGIIAGFISVFFLKKISPASKIKKKDIGFWQKLKLPLEDINFKKFIVFTATWAFVVALVSPFFSVYMIETLRIPFSLITIFSVIAGITNILGMKLWGSFIDKYGAKSILYICSTIASLIPALWIFASAENYIIIWFINIISGFCWSGIGLASSNTMMNLAPSENNPIYFAVFSAITGLAGALAPILGGLLASIFINIEIFSLSGLRLLFLSSAVLRLSTIFLLRNIEISQNITIKEVLEKFNSWQKIMPIYILNRFTVFNINQRGNINILISRAMINLEKNLEELLSRKRKKEEDK